jgi:hypothetical protein
MSNDDWMLGTGGGTDGSGGQSDPGHGGRGISGRKTGIDNTTETAQFLDIFGNWADHETTVRRVCVDSARPRGKIEGE